MNTPGDQHWSQPDQMNAMTQSISNDLDDLGNLFEFGDIDLNTTPSVEPMSFDHMQHQPGTHPNTPFNELNDPMSLPTSMAQDFGGQGQFGNQNQFMSQENMQSQTSMSYSNDSIYQPVMQQQYQPNQQFQFQQQQQQNHPPGRNGIPPTPNSFEMHGENGRFLQQSDNMDPQQRFMLDQRYNVRKDDAIAYTPLASPAGTPQYNVQPEFTIPGAYFSPLTSPMLHAQRQQQQQQQQQQGYYANPNTAPSSTAPSPIDPSIDVDMMGDGMSLPEPASSQNRKQKRKIATPRSTAMRIKQSPIQKPQQKRKSSTLATLIPAGEVDGVVSEAQKSSQGQANMASSEDGSISPEHLTEALMGPPPRPGSRIQSPAIAALQQEARKAAAGSAATPHSILSMRNNSKNGSTQQSPQTAPQASSSSNGLDDLILPESASGEAAHRPTVTHLDTSSSGEQTPKLSASRKTPKLGPLSTPSSANAGSAVASPSISGSPMTMGTPGSFLRGKQDPKGKNLKKRGSSSAGVMVSPALRPRISPSIKPLLPEGTPLSSPTHALLLASKSNYQNLLEGNHLPGVNYPDHLSTGLTSKRTSHKVAEQGRRNRINDALKEMQALLPKTASTPKSAKEGGSDASPNAAEAEDAKESKESKESKEEAAARNSNSKASTVESANEYIRRLQKENALLQQGYADMKKKLEAQGTPETAAAAGGASSSSAESTASASASPAAAKA